MSELKITQNSLENAILKDGNFISGYVTSDDAYIDATEYGAHAEGMASLGAYILADGQGAHAEGYAVSVGNYILAKGDGAHAEGINTKALADGAHAGGICTIANSSAMTAIGKYNVSTGNENTLFVVGCGNVAAGRNLLQAEGWVEEDGHSATYYDVLNIGKFYIKSIDIHESMGGERKCEISPKEQRSSININANHQINLNSSLSINLEANTTINGSLNVINDVSCKTLHVINGAYQTSDINLKDIISEDISLEKAYDVLEKCHIIQYVLKGDESKKEQIGMIAQEIKEYFPEIISESKDGILSLDYARLSVILFRLVKDLSKKNDDLNNKISIIEEKLKNL